jgi:hypothetical protein
MIFKPDPLARYGIHQTFHMAGYLRRSVSGQIPLDSAGYGRLAECNFIHPYDELGAPRVN